MYFRIEEWKRYFRASYNIIIFVKETLYSYDYQLCQRSQQGQVIQKEKGWIGVGVSSCIYRFQTM